MKKYIVPAIIFFIIVLTVSYFWVKKEESQLTSGSQYSVHFIGEVDKVIDGDLYLTIKEATDGDLSAAGLELEDNLIIENIFEKNNIYDLDGNKVIEFTVGEGYDLTYLVTYVNDHPYPIQNYVLEETSFYNLQEVE